MRCVRLAGVVLVLGMGACFPGRGIVSGLQQAEFSGWKNPQAGVFSWLLDFVGRPTSVVVADPRFGGLRDGPLSILKAKFDLGDPVGGRTLVRDELLSALGGFSDRVTASLGRYVVLSGCRTAACTDRALVWVDTERGLVLAVLVAPASQDLPGTTPNVILASRQLDTKRIEWAELPERFREDWADWAYRKRLPVVMTERLVNTYGGLSVIFHEDGDVCRDAMTTVSAIECGQQAVAAAQADMEALLASLSLHFAAGDVGRPALDRSQQEWTAYRDTACAAAAALFAGGTEAPVAELECRRRLTQDRVRTLNALYYMPLYD